MDLKRLEEAFFLFEKKLRAQGRRRRLMGVKEVDRPTYEKHITGPVERFDRRKNAFMAMIPDNPFGEEFRERFKARTGIDHYSKPLPYGELEPSDRIGQSLTSAAWRLCREYHPQTLSVTSAEARVDVTDKVWMSRFIKKVARWFGAEMVRIARVDQRWVYKNVDIPHEYAIIAVVPHATNLNKTAPSHLSGLAVADTYSRLKVITTQLADFICGLGYDAMYRETLGWTPEILMVPMAIDAGVGELGRTGRVLSPEFGINMRLKAVTTDLPLEPDKPISFGVEEFCLACEKCARFCPAQAVPFGPPTEPPPGTFYSTGVRKWYVQADRCLMFWAANRKKWTTCGGRCISVCPWNKPINPYHNVVRALAIRGRATWKKTLVNADRLLYPPARNGVQK